MSSLHELMVSGVRAFGPDNAQKIKFFTPLTLIVGENGSGKTTIIEALKFASTGELPPGAKTGGTWIHDPKLVGKKDVKACVKLGFVATTGARMIASRRLEAVQTKTKVTQKGLDATLLVVSNGEKKSLSSRAAELDSVVPMYLGVSKAVLENVIFCHQDESLWPLSESSVLKKKFDEIFEAKKYTNAIANIKDLRKKYNEELGKFKIIEEHTKQDKDRGAQLEKRSKELGATIETLDAESSTLETQMIEAAEKMRIALENAGKFEVTIGQIVNLRNQQQFLHQRIDQLGQDLEPKEESDEVLRSQLEGHQERLESFQKRREECHDRYNQVKREIDNVRSQQDVKRTEVGTYKEQKRAHERKLEERQELVKSTAKEYSIRGYDADLDDEQIGEFMDRIARLSKDQTSKVEKLRRENAAEARKVQDILNELNGKRTEAQQSKNHAKAQVTENDRKIGELQSELERITSDEGGKAVIEANIEDLQTKLARYREEASSAAYDERLQSLNNQVRQGEDRAESLNRELMESTKQSTSLAKLDHLRQEVKGKQTGIKTMLSTYGKQLQGLIGHEVNADTLENEAADALSSKLRDLSEAHKERDAVSRELEKVELQRSSAKTQAKEKLDEATSIGQKIANAIHSDKPDDYIEILNELQINRDTRAEDVKGYHVLTEWYEKCIKVAREKNCCRLCMRGFEDAPELEKHLQRLKKSATATKFDTLTEELHDLESQLKEASDVRGAYDIWLRLKDEETPALQKQLSGLETQRKDLLQKLESHDTTVSEREETKKDAESASKIAANISRAQKELEKLQREVDELIANQSQDNKLRALTDVKDDIDTVNREVRELRAEQSKMQSEEKHSRDQISTAELELSKAKSRLITADAELERRTIKLVQIDDLKRSNQQQRAAMGKHDEELQQIEPRLQEEQSRLDDMNRQGQNRESEMQRQVNDMMNSLNVLTNSDREIRYYNDHGGPTKLTQCEREIEVLDSNVQSLESEHKQVTNEINTIQTELSNADRLKRIISDNLKFREAQRELQQNQTDLEQLEEQDAEADQARYRKEYDRCRRYHEHYHTERTSKMSEWRAKDDELLRSVKEWETHYQGAAKAYKKAQIEVATTKAAIEDLGRYGSALDKAIMKFHSLKMEEINEIINELWQSTYKGHDVEQLSIRSESLSSKGARTHNYRVVMVKQGQEMDMRGRCSAGQRVLACIIIRLALAECFGVNCGMIALDEPTTNLDVENIASLAESLHEIVKARMKQKNFQLIVITHDEGFLRHMRVSDFTDKFWKVDRDDMARSRTHPYSIAEVMEG